jgi:hypothetical protein
MLKVYPQIEAIVSHSTAAQNFLLKLPQLVENMKMRIVEHRCETSTQPGFLDDQRKRITTMRDQSLFFA